MPNFTRVERELLETAVIWIAGQDESLVKLLLWAYRGRNRHEFEQEIRFDLRQLRRQIDARLKNQLRRVDA